MIEYYPALLMFLVVCGSLMLGYPVAFTLAGSSLICALIGASVGLFDATFLSAMPNKLFSIMINQTLLAVPLFVLMGVTLERSKISESLLSSLGVLMQRLPAGLPISVILVGVLLAASTGIVGATVVTMGLLSMPTLLKQGYSPTLASGTICATGTLGQIIPPSIALILLGDVISNAYQQAQLNQGIYSPENISVGDLFVGAIIPGITLVVCYILYVFLYTLFKNNKQNTALVAEHESKSSLAELLNALLPPLVLIILVLGSILAGIATTTEAASIGAVGALFLAAFKRLVTRKILREICLETALITSMVFMILIGAAVFSLVFLGFGGDELIHQLFQSIPGGTFGATLAVMIAIFFLGFILDFIEITFIVIPLVGPALLSMGLDPIWLGILIAINLQTSFLTPPFGFALFYFRGVAPNTVSTAQIYKGVIPFIAIQIFVMILIAIFPGMATWLPSLIYQ